MIRYLAYDWWTSKAANCGWRTWSRIHINGKKNKAPLECTFDLISPMATVPKSNLVSHVITIGGEKLALPIKLFLAAAVAVHPCEPPPQLDANETGGEMDKRSNG